MTTRDAIAAACDIRPNSLDEKVLAGYLNFLDAEFSEVLQVPLPDNLWPENQELLVPEPVSRVYINWLCAIIDWAQVDMDLYQIDTEQYAVAYEEARAWLRRHYLPKVSGTGAKLEWFPRPPRPQDARTETESSGGSSEQTGGGGKPSVDWSDAETETGGGSSSSSGGSKPSVDWGDEP